MTKTCCLLRPMGMCLQKLLVQTLLSPRPLNQESFINSLFTRLQTNFVTFYEGPAQKKLSILSLSYLKARRSDEILARVPSRYLYDYISPFVLKTLASVKKSFYTNYTEHNALLQKLNSSTIFSADRFLANS